MSTIQIFCLSLRLINHVRYMMVAATIANAKPPNLIFVLSHKDSSFSTSFFIYTESCFILLNESIMLRKYAVESIFSFEWDNSLFVSLKCH